MTDTAVWTLPEISHRDRGEYSCAVIKPPPYIIGLTNASAALGHPAFLHCQTQSITKVEIRWLRHGVTVLNGMNTIVYPNGTLRIHQTSRSDGGVYECQARNTGGLASQSTILKILELPKAAVSPTNLYFVPRTSFNISCYVYGDPKPEPHWFYNGRRIHPDHKYYITFKNDLIVRDPHSSDAGIYECRAVSSAGSHADSATVHIAVPPKVELTQSKSMIGRGDSISFECLILDGTPQPHLQWFRNGRELLQSSNEYMRINGGHLSILGAQDADAGTYSCVAENIAGRDIGVVKVAVTLQCRAIGQPMPTISWQRDDVDLETLDNPRYTVLADGNLLITNAQLEDQTRFTCIAKNDYGQQSKSTMLMVIGLDMNMTLFLVSPVLGHVPPEEQLIEGEDLRLSCVVVLGTPKPNILWYKDGKPLEPSSSLILEGGGSSLLLRNGNPRDEGRYTCAAISPAGNATLNVNVQLIKKPEFVIEEGAEASIAGGEVSVREGQLMEIPCKVRGTPTPAITWSLDGRPISVNSRDYTITQDNTLIIHSADKTTAGTYTCSAMNPAGESEQSTSIAVITVPVISPGQSSFNLIQGTPVTIPCDVFMEPMPDIKYLNGEPFKGGYVDEKGSLTIEDAEELHRGQLKCVASNEAGMDERLVTLTVHTTPIIDGSGQYQINEKGELVLPSVQLDNTGHYTCLVSNLAGDDSITYSMEVHEKPLIISDTPGTIDVIKGLTLEIPCKAKGTPEPDRVWEKDGIQNHRSFCLQLSPIIPPLKATWRIIKYDIDGTLVIAEVSQEDATFYTCKASNPAGKAEKVIRLSVIVPPDIPDQDIVSHESVKVNNPFSLYCPVFSTPLPMITWHLDDRSLSDSDSNVILSEDRRRLHVVKARTTDAGVYKCIARNSAGESSKTFDVEVVVPLNVDETDWKRKITVLEGEEVKLGCPVSGLPAPSINWIVGGRILKPEEDIRGVRLDASGNTVRGIPLNRNMAVSILINQARLDHAELYHCVAQNKAGSLDVDIDLRVLEKTYYKDTYQSIVGKVYGYTKVHSNRQ
uniref:Ig-like domain-containing protein n=1 Tax=Heterorhabditis bacteriophora TaxID=37862 RepID=A0A1I7X4J4_HETBA